MFEVARKLQTAPVAHCEIRGDHRAECALNRFVSNIERPLPLY